MGLFSNSKELKKAIWIYEAHRCGGCGKMQAAKHKASVGFSYDEIAVSRSGENRNTAEKQFAQIEKELVDRINDPKDIGKFYDLNLLGKCRKCGHKEPWSRMRMPGFEPVFNILVTMSVLGTVAGIANLFVSKDGLLLFAAAGIIALTAVIKTAEVFRRRKKEREIASLGDRAPYLTTDEAAFREKYPDVDIDALEKIEPAGNYRLKFM